MSIIRRPRGLAVNRTRFRSQDPHLLANMGVRAETRGRGGPRGVGRPE